MLEYEDVRVAVVSLRLGTAFCKPNLCPRIAMVDVSETHGLSSKKTQGKHARRTSSMILVIACLLALIFSESTGLSRLDKKRPNELTLIH